MLQAITACHAFLGSYCAGSKACQRPALPVSPCILQTAPEIRLHVVQATAEDLQYLNLIGSRAEAGSTFWKLPRDTFLVAVCNEAVRLEAAVAAAVPQLFEHIASGTPLGGLQGRAAFATRLFHASHRQQIAEALACV